MSNKAKVKSFLQELKQTIKIWDIYFIDRPKNSVHYLAELGITANMRKDIILQLELEDYSQGPNPETQYGGTELWIFGKTINTEEIYIKLTISKKTSNAICISFHKAEHSMEFPFKDQDNIQTIES